MGKRILVVDDDYKTRQDIKQILTELGHQVVSEAEAPKAAIHAMVSSMPDVILLDLIFPEAQGISIIRSMLNIEKDAKIIVISGVKVETFILDALTNGALAYISKPLSKFDLQKELDSI